jgi:hypothetical protein
MPTIRTGSRIFGVIAITVLFAGCMNRPAAIQATATLPSIPVLPTTFPTQPASPPPIATETSSATETQPPTQTPAITTDWSAIRCVPKTPEDITRCPQSPNPVTDKDKFIEWFAKWAKQMDTLKPGPSVGYGYISIDQDGSQHYILTVTKEGLAGTFWFADQGGQKVLVMAMANGIVDDNNLYHGQYHLIALVNKTTYKGLIGGGISPEEEINCLQPNTAANLSTLSMITDGDNYLEKAVGDTFQNGVLADASSLRVGFIWPVPKY